MFPEGPDRIWWFLALWVFALAAGAMIFWRWRLRERARARMWAEDDAAAEASEVAESDLEQRSALGRWLYLAGFRAVDAPAAFVLASVATTSIGCVLAFALIQGGITAEAVRAADNVPGGAGDLAKPLVASMPWLAILVFALAPFAFVSSRRQQRVRDIESDMPVTLELLATMSESGLAFDQAVGEVIDASDEKRPLFAELRSFQGEVAGGVPRIQCFRRLARRVEVPSMSAFVSALVQAEQVGAGFTRVLRTQADDLRGRRREDATMLAESLSVKLVFPLVLCFLPGIFVATLGPTFLQFLKLMSGLTGGRS